MLKVMNIISDTNIGGAGRVLINYLKYRDKENFDVSVALPRGSKLKEPLEALGSVVYEVDGMADKSMDPGVIKELRKLIRRVGPDVVHTHGSMSGRIAARREGRVVIYTRHSVFPTKSYSRADSSTDGSIRITRTRSSRCPPRRWTTLPKGGSPGSGSPF